MALIKHGVLLVTTVTIAFGQRGSFAGFRPIGYPEIAVSTPATDELGNRFGEDNSTSTTTQRLPIEANGDKALVDRLSKLPIDQQPFWFINWQAIEANMQKPQTYPQRPSQFAGSQAQPQQDFNRDTATGTFGSGPEVIPSKPGGNRDVDVSALLPNNGSPSLSTNSPFNSDRTTPKPVEDVLGNRFGNEDNAKPAATPTQNVPTSPVVRPIQSPPPTSQATYPVISQGQVVESFATMPFVFNKYPAYPSPSSSIQKEVVPTTNAPPTSRIVNGILTDDPDYPYPILDPKTRDPSLITHNARPSMQPRPVLLRNGFRDYDFEEQVPIFAPYPYGGYFV